jgi:hypothetical protein
MDAQRSVNGWSSVTLESSTTVAAKFCHQGIALFHNATTPDEETGASFVVPSGLEIEVSYGGQTVDEDPGIDIMEVDAVAFVDCRTT